VNIHAKATTSTPAMSSEEWQARVDLAAVYRLVAQHGWDDVPTNQDRPVLDVSVTPLPGAVTCHDDREALTPPITCARC
jgi:hypothetical protein